MISIEIFQIFTKYEKIKFLFSRTKIQMILTEETRKEQDEYYKLFKDIVDEVSVKQYTERGGNLSDLNEKFYGKLSKNNDELIKEFGSEAAAVMKDSKIIFIYQIKDFHVNNHFKDYLQHMMAKSECVVMIGGQLILWDILINLDMRMVIKSTKKLRKSQN